MVGLNYRLGPLGFLTGKGTDVTANLGLHDQVLALKWVQANVHHFGGDPNQVTVFGESAGSRSVDALILSPLTKGLFHRAIMESGTAIGLLTDMDETVGMTTALMDLVNCSTSEGIAAGIECLKTTPVESLQKACLEGKAYNAPFTTFRPILGFGDDFCPDSAVQTLKKGKFHGIDLMIGVMNDEGSLFVVANNSAILTTNLTAKAAWEAIHKLMYREPQPEAIANYYTRHLKQYNMLRDSADFADWYQFVLKHRVSEA